MGKKKAADGESSGFNMSSSIRDILTENARLNSREVIEELMKRFPTETINKNSANVAFSNARRKLGIKSGRHRKVRMRKPDAVSPGSYQLNMMRGSRSESQGMPRSASRHEMLDFDTLKAAKKFISEVGSAEKALQALQQIQSLQIG